ncbi:unnamed protein product, partial [Mesorhabditis belari]|uniref:Uncharacterized protein n=1 Tax=Mesorhabditis belari TaxID=2138241 RepID=A0AAF3FPH5_9BILA
MNVSQIASTACGMCDIDTGPNLYSNAARHWREFTYSWIHRTLKPRFGTQMPTDCETAFKAHHQQNAALDHGLEDQFLLSVGTSNKMWISKEEYEDGGRGIVEKKCP